MRKYYLDTSGLSTPLEFMPEDIHSSIWTKISGLITEGTFAVTTEIYEELGLLPGPIGDCIKANESCLQLELEDNSWPWQEYLEHYEQMKVSMRA